MFGDDCLDAPAADMGCRYLGRQAMGHREKMQVEGNLGSRWHKTLTPTLRSLGLVLSKVGAFKSINFLVLFLCCPSSLP